MSKYTCLENSDVDNFIEDKLNIIKNEIISLLHPENIKAIILTGSFGRGEGGVIIEDNNIHLINYLSIFYNL